MSEIRVTFDKDGVLPQLARKLGSVKKFGKFLRPIVDRVALGVQFDLKKYPPPPANSRYIRTFKLRNSWQVRRAQMKAGVVSAKVRSDGSARNRSGRYGGFVMDETMQASVHRGRWHTVQSVADDFQPVLARSVATQARLELARIMR